MFSKDTGINVLGYGGGFMSLTAYTLIANDLISNVSAVYLALNFVAGVSLMYYTFKKKAYANTILNSIWSLISIIAIARIIY